MEDSTELSHQYHITTTESTSIDDASLLSDMITSASSSIVEAAAKEAMKNDLQQQSVVTIGELVTSQNTCK